MVQRLPRRRLTLKWPNAVIRGFLSGAWLNRILFCVTAVVTLYVVLTRVPHHLTAIVLPDLSRVFDYFATEGSSEISLILRTHVTGLRRIITLIFDNNQLLRFEASARPWNPSIKDKLVFVFGISEISVVIPALNEGRYLSACLKSLTNQSYSGDYEVIVVDGGSTDGTVQIAKRFTDHIVCAAKRPVGAARNEGARVANGKILAFIDADTIASDGWLRAIGQSFKDQSIIGVTGPTLPSDGAILDSVTYRLWTIYLQRVLLSMGMPHVIGFNCAYRRNTFLEIGGFDERSKTSEDIRLARKMRRFGRIRFEKQMSALTSARRFRKYGRAYIAGLYLLNGFSTLLLDRSFNNYPPVR